MLDKKIFKVLCWIFSYLVRYREKTQIKLRIYNTDTSKHEKNIALKSLEETEKNDQTK